MKVSTRDLMMPWEFPEKQHPFTRLVENTEKGINEGRLGDSKKHP